MSVVIATGSTSELKRELSAFGDKVTKMEHSLQQVCVFPVMPLNLVVADDLVPCRASGWLCLYVCLLDNFQKQTPRLLLLLLQPLFYSSWDCVRDYETQLVPER